MEHLLVGTRFVAHDNRFVITHVDEDEKTCSIDNLTTGQSQHNVKLHYNEDAKNREVSIKYDELSIGFIHDHKLTMSSQKIANTRDI